MAKRDQILDEGLLKQKNQKQKSTVATDLVNMLIGMFVMILFIAGIVFAVSALLK